MECFIQELNVCKRLAHAAGRAILETYKGSFEVHHKTDNSPVTRADLQSHDIIVSGLQETFPDDAVLSEEGIDDPHRISKRRVWIVDPLDGTREFVSMSGQFVINIALSIDGKPVLGLIYCPTRGETYYGIVGAGAFREDTQGTIPIQVSSQELLNEAIHTRGKTSTHHLIAHYDSIAKSTIRLGSALKGCLVANGEADFYVRTERLWEWDLCAMHALVEAAGGLVTDLDGEGITYNHPDSRLAQGFLVSNKALHHHLLRINRQFSPEPRSSTPR